MRKFPKAESEIVALAQQMATGLEVNALTFPAPPVLFDAINDKITASIGARDAMTAAKAASLAATAAKNVALDDLIDAMQQVLRYAENIPGYGHEELSLLGWSARREDTPLEAPGSSPLLTVTGEGPGDLSLRWHKPTAGGAPASYLLERREQGTETWNLIEVVSNREVTLTEQPRGTSLEYRVVSMNRAGKSSGSNAVTVVL